MNIKSINIVPNVLYIAWVDEKLTMGIPTGKHLMGVFVPTLRSAVYMDHPGELTCQEGNITIRYITLQKFLSSLGKGDLTSVLLAYSYTNKDAVVFQTQIWREQIIENLEKLINFDLYGTASIIHKYLRYFRYTKEYIEELKQLREEIQQFDKDDSIHDIIDLIDWQHYKIIRPYQTHSGEIHHTTVGIDLLGRKMQDVRVDVLIDRIDMDLGDYYKRKKKLTPDILKKVFISLHIYGHLTFQRHVTFPFPKLLREIINQIIQQTDEACIVCMLKKFIVIDDIDVEDNFFYVHSRKVIEHIYRSIYNVQFE